MKHLQLVITLLYATVAPIGRWIRAFLARDLSVAGLVTAIRPLWSLTTTTILGSRSDLSLNSSAWGTRRSVSLLVLALTAISLLLPAVATAEKMSSTLEARVKAVVLFNFAKYTKWPEATLANEVQPIRICVMGENPFKAIFNSPQAPKDAQGRPFEVKEFTEEASTEEVGTCQILFWKSASKDAIKRLQPTFKEKAVLTVSDQESKDSLISFVIRNDRVRFIIKRKAAEDVGLSFSSQLLKLAILED